MQVILEYYDKFRYDKKDVLSAELERERSQRCSALVLREYMDSWAEDLIGLEYVNFKRERDTVQIAFWEIYGRL